MMCQTGQFAKVIEELRIPPPSCPPITKAADEVESDEESQVLLVYHSTMYFFSVIVYIIAIRKTDWSIRLINRMVRGDEN